MWHIGAVSHRIYAPSFENITNGCEYLSYNKAPQTSHHCRDGCSSGIFRTASIDVALEIGLGLGLGFGIGLGLGILFWGVLPKIPA